MDEKDSGELTILHRAVLLNKVEFVEVLVSDEIKAGEQWLFCWCTG